MFGRLSRTGLCVRYKTGHLFPTGRTGAALFGITSGRCAQANLLTDRQLHTHSIILTENQFETDTILYIFSFGVLTV